MEPGDEPEAFLVTFERVVTAAYWPPEHWATLLVPYLTGPAQIAYHNLDPCEALDYVWVKAAIFNLTGISPETYQQQFCTGQFPARARPCAVAQHLQDGCWRWLAPQGLMGLQVAEVVILEQFIQILLPGGKEWVQRHRP